MNWNKIFILLRCIGGFNFVFSDSFRVSSFTSWQSFEIISKKKKRKDSKKNSSQLWYILKLEIFHHDAIISYKMIDNQYPTRSRNNNPRWRTSIISIFNSNFKKNTTKYRTERKFEHFSRKKFATRHPDVVERVETKGNLKKKKKRNISYTVCVSFSRLFINSVCCNFSSFSFLIRLIARFFSRFLGFFAVPVSELIVAGSKCITSHVPWHSFVICFSICALLLEGIVSAPDCTVPLLFPSSISCNRSTTSVRFEWEDGLFLHPMFTILWMVSIDLASLPGVNTIDIEFPDPISITLFPLFSIIWERELCCEVLLDGDVLAPFIFILFLLSLLFNAISLVFFDPSSLFFLRINEMIIG